MRVSLEGIRFINSKFGCAANPAPDGIDALVEKIGAQLGAVEEVIDLSKKYEGILVAKVVSSVKHPNADKLSVCLVDDAKAAKGVKRDAKGLVEVICGAPNVAEGQLVVWLPPGVTVPSTVGKDPLVLESREIRGVVSSGMIASAKELDLGDDHSGILVLEPPAKPGRRFAEVAGLDDFVIDIENKMFTHRPDLFGLIGIARELAGIQGHVFKSPSWYKEKPTLPSANGPATHKLMIKNSLPKLVPRFTAVVLKDVKVGPSPLWLLARLTSAGIKPVNNIVDILNFMTYATAQPVHAYDYDKLAGSLEVRAGKAGEKLELLGGKVIELKSTDIVIASGGKAVGLGGIMGGLETSVSAETRNIVIECANFNMNAIRRSTFEHGLFTDAATRFTKNQSPRQNLTVTVRLIEEVKKVAGGRLAGPVIDDKHFQSKDIKVQLTAGFINERLGLELSPARIKRLLENVEFGVSTTGSKLSVTVPFWRTDIAIAEDIVEEVGRLYGYDHLPIELPTRDLTPAGLNPMLELKARLREILSAAGANEVLTYSFVHGSLMEKVGQDASRAFHVKNALSPDLQYYRLSLAPSLLEKVHPNIKLGFDKFVLFELGQAFSKDNLGQDGLPLPKHRLALVGTKAKASKDDGAAYYAAKKQLDNLLRELGVSDVSYEPVKDGQNKTGTYYEPGRSSNITVNGKQIGLVGEYRPSVAASLKLPEFCSGFEVHTDELLEFMSPSIYQPLNRFPETIQDISVRLPAPTSYAEIANFMDRQLVGASVEHGYRTQIELIDIFQRPGDKTHRQVTLRISLEHPERTLTTDEVNRLLDKIAAAAKDEIKAERI